MEGIEGQTSALLQRSSHFEIQAAVDALLRADLSAYIRKVVATVSPGANYVHSWHIDAIAYHLQQVLDGLIKRLIITMPPRSLKSICASVALSTWALGRDPSKRIICASYAQELSASLSNDSRRVMRELWYRRAFPGTRIDPAKDTEAEFRTTEGGYRLGTSVGGPLTGRGGSLIIVDDPLKPQEALSRARRDSALEWYKNTLYSRLDNKVDDAIVVVMQRLHQDDLVGYLLEQEGWVHLCLPAIAEADARIPIGDSAYHFRKAGDLLQPKREPLSVLDDVKATIGSFNFAAQYQQQPVPEEGHLIKLAWFPAYEQAPQREPDDLIVQSWDTANKAGELNDYSACVTALVRRNTCYVLEVNRGRFTYPELKRKVIEQARKHRAEVVLMEDACSGTSLIQEIRTDQPEGVVTPIPIRPEGDKVMRVSNQSAKIESGQVHLPHQAPWLGDFRAEIAAVPGGRNDDQVDALVQLLAWLGRRRVDEEDGIFGAPILFEHRNIGGEMQMFENGVLCDSWPDVDPNSLYG